MDRTAPHNKEPSTKYLVQNINSANIEKLWFCVCGLKELRSKCEVESHQFFFFCFYSSEFFIQSPWHWICSVPYFFNLPSDKAWWSSSTQAQWLDRKCECGVESLWMCWCRQGHDLVEEFSVSRFLDNSLPGIISTSSNGWCLYLLLSVSRIYLSSFLFLPSMQPK